MPVSDDRSWQITEPWRIDFDDPVTELDVRVVGGTVNVVGTQETTTRVEVGEVEGPPLLVRREGGRLIVAYEDLPWGGFLKWLDRKGRRRKAEVSVRVPADVALSVGVVGATAVVSGIHGGTKVAGVSGATTLVGLRGPVTAETVSGDVETQRLSGPLRFSTVSGDLTCVDGALGTITADSVSGAIILDLNSSRADGPAAIRLSSVSGELAVRLPADADLTVEAQSAGGAVSSAFERLTTTGWGCRRVAGALGGGRGALQANSVSGGVALLRRPPGADGLGEGPRPGDRVGAAQGAGAARGGRPPGPPGGSATPGNPTSPKDL
ncbi:DUF4097 family beta strand repeat-containing protein [Streptomyces reniochalinae]|uniref:DUF4097 domain-containing protein n=1 Tax=Streptomyces reniochalinae TaxID=2250578 RepID=A0A367E5U5_9ACTN|nr:DUF4097 family beta strand repeat-containing protein [Streptomyces reniochalinae]RCG13436.1 hypothetical protein DQ392_32640 [Streptomyces reniochalinae]